MPVRSLIPDRTTTPTARPRRLDTERGFGRDTLRRSCSGHPVNLDSAGQDERMGALAGFGKSSTHKRHIQSLARHPFELTGAGG